MLEINNLNLWLALNNNDSRQILYDINFTVNPGEVVALIGESGSGKTMTGLAILRLLPRKIQYSNSSQILLNDSNLLDLPEYQMRKVRGAQISMIFQDPHTSLNPVQTIGRQITEVLSIHLALTGRAAYIEVLRLLELVRIPNPVRCYASYPHELSGGMKQRVAIAMALACRPTILIADEPTTALDVTIQAEIMKLLLELQKSNNMAMIFITHNLALAQQVADQVVVMRNGKIIEHADKNNLLSKPQTTYTKELLNSVQNLQPLMKEYKQSEDNILHVRNLKVYYPIKSGLIRHTIGYVKAVDGVDLNLKSSCTLAIVGESGCGKTSLAKAMVGLLSEATGEVNYADVNLLRLKARNWFAYRHDIQFIFQNPYAALDPKLPVLLSLLEGVKLLNQIKSSEQTMQDLEQLILDVGLDPNCIYKYPHEFSGGERQRLCIVRALMVKPKIIICDEPTSSLDVSVQAMVLNLLANLQAKYNLSYLIITHDFGVVARLAHEVAVMNNGVIVEYGTVNQVLKAPQHQYTKQLLAAVPCLS